MLEYQRKFITQNLKYLCDNTSNLTELLISLKSKEVLSIPECEVITQGIKGATRQYEQIYGAIINKPDESYDLLIECLEESENGDAARKLQELDLFGTKQKFTGSSLLVFIQNRKMAVNWKTGSSEMEAILQSIQSMCWRKLICNTAIPMAVVLCGSPAKRNHFPNFKFLNHFPWNTIGTYRRLEEIIPKMKVSDESIGISEFDLEDLLQLAQKIVLKSKTKEKHTILYYTDDDSPVLPDEAKRESLTGLYKKIRERMKFNVVTFNENFDETKFYAKIGGLDSLTVCKTMDCLTKVLPIRTVTKMCKVESQLLYLSPELKCNVSLHTYIRNFKSPVYRNKTAKRQPTSRISNPDASKTKRSKIDCSEGFKLSSDSESEESDEIDDDGDGNAISDDNKHEEKVIQMDDLDVAVKNELTDKGEKSIEVKSIKFLSFIDASDFDPYSWYTSEGRLMYPKESAENSEKDLFQCLLRHCTTEKKYVLVHVISFDEDLGHLSLLMPMGECKLNIGFPYDVGFYTYRLPFRDYVKYEKPSYAPKKKTGTSMKGIIDELDAPNFTVLQVEDEKLKYEWSQILGLQGTDDLYKI